MSLYEVVCPKCGCTWGYDQKGNLIRHYVYDLFPTVLNVERICPICELERESEKDGVL